MKYPPIVYKYRNFTSDSHKAVLHKNELFYAAPKYMNDPFDCRIPLCPELLDTEEKIDSYVGQMINNNRQQLLQRGDNIEELRNNYIERLKNDMPAEQQFAMSIEFSALDQRLGIISMSSKWDSILMWSHYGDYHKGICYGFHEEKLRNSGRFGGGGKVSYSDKFPRLDPLEEKPMRNSFLQTHTKAKKWRYEKEYRFFTYYPENVDPESERRKAYAEDNEFAEIILGLNFPDTDIPEVLKFALEKQVPVYKACKVAWKFELFRERIN
ncbi:MAG: DUF2971 domain-containing protein [Flavobacteriales bacterium]